MKAEKVFEIAKRVYEDYPVTGKEKTCAAHKKKQDGKRFERVKRIIEEHQEKVEGNVTNEP